MGSVPPPNSRSSGLARPVLYYTGVMLTFIFVVFSGAAVVFMLTFLNAIIRELRLDRAYRSVELGEGSLTLVMLEHHRRKDLAA